MFKAIRKAFGGSRNDENTSSAPQRLGTSPRASPRARTHSRPGSSPRQKSRKPTLTGGARSRNASQGDYIAKQKVTLWNYGNGGTTLIPYNVPEKVELEQLKGGEKWWKMKTVNEDRRPKTIGYAAKYYFAHRDVEELHGTAPWFFGEMSRKEAESLLSDTANPDGSFLVRGSGSSGRDVISIKYFDFEETDDFRYAHYDVKTGNGQLWLGGSGGTQRKFCLLTDLVAFCMGGKLEGLKTKLTNICLIPNPHSDPYFEFYSQDHDSLRVPFNEITLGKKLGSGQFGDVFKGTFRDNLDVAIKCLKLLRTDEGQKVLEDFQNEIETQKGLHHPNLIQLFGFVTHPEKGNFMIQEYMGKGDLKTFLVALRQDQAKLEREKSLLWGKLITWCLEVARGMQRLEALGIVHRDLAARNVLLDRFDRAKVADFGLALPPSRMSVVNEKLPIKWTAPEALFMREFTSLSDVWSFGILMFEVLSIGEMPYREIKMQDYKRRMKAEWELYQAQGKMLAPQHRLRCSRPENLPEFDISDWEFGEAVQVMFYCWEIEPTERLTFTNLLQHLDSLVASEYEETEY